ncbi:tRNA threonylcarbamoyladenosine biosynthesis protein TsaE [Rhodothalassium salexigens DSM 2132]|uniref:tRNA threonylcarbamoyladenosine biosynthesis protein TsaE n=1 Tax=Rhodothalassium salexigens DSM 2132 TaxID=1188247 RepID=A0A4R2PLA3_RHOSA|nr:tRNA (adenosine(37)-N6)-threonylcarbamoyltransferase complex ATPase subunit type 1 TsaE [Rhodothalassium salexigens]MBB4210953.1 tRNA threonylcarbamoyladenosine biosynthesis protein TsaE [Rhodothalassium salexigens DSM 2132]TCP36389.1 tRNA threonylcarbamoyladenosine biosynthesis protein TsaE [Rhodothalassium salexigens DSM 2132]
MTSPAGSRHLSRGCCLPDAMATERAGASLGRAVATALDRAMALEGAAGPSAVIGLTGPLGAGKTCFARAFVRAYLGDPGAEVPSPTFTLVQHYEPPAPSGRPPLWHADLYRLGDPDEIHELDLLGAGEAAVVLVEWPDRAGPYWPDDAVEVALAIAADDSRTLTLSAPPAWTALLEALP